MLIDGTDIRDVTVSSLREQIGLVPQDTLLFNTTIRENILYGRLDASDEEVWEAVRAANAEKFIKELPNGIETKVGDRGLVLSGGQRQRIAIARALLKIRRSSSSMKRRPRSIRRARRSCRTRWTGSWWAAHLS